MLKTPFYDPTKSYEDNYKEGPFGAFIDGTVYQQSGEPPYDFFGHKVYLPFGIPAGPILNSAYVKGAFEKGFDLVVYKTVRSGIFPCHPHPNVLPVELEGDLTIERAEKPLVVKEDYSEPLSITNSFGVPSKDPSEWQDDVKKALSYAGKGQVLILSFMGTVRPNQTPQEFIDDFVLAAKLATETGATVLEANLSCPNIGNEGLVCYNLSATDAILKAVRKEIGDLPLIVKTGYFADEGALAQFAESCANYAHAISAINTIAAPIVDKNGNQALPGSPMRLKSGVCGTSIKWAGIEMVKRLKKLKEEKGYSYKIEGVGGVMNAQDYQDFLDVGADAVMSATGAMWNPLLAQEIKQKVLK
ncbi:hypothetical protein HGA88_02165 [Candidatus Roizmanbacteria bacterium]|nr:hypothetical protein [Candidatus Roizmanbacteria bacterium]